MSLLIISCMFLYERGRGGPFETDVGEGGGVGTQDDLGPLSLDDR